MKKKAGTINNSGTNLVSFGVRREEGRIPWGERKKKKGASEARAFGSSGPLSPLSKARGRERGETTPFETQIFALLRVN